jgi:hypothetical protein
LTMRNLREQMNGLFQESIDSLLNHLEDCDSTNKVLYIQTRLKQLKQRELRYGNLAKMEGIKHELKYTSLFKEYLELEVDYIRETKDINFIPALPAAPKQKALTTATKISFNYKHTDTSNLLNSIKQLCLKINLLKQAITTPEQLLEVLTTNEINFSLPAIHFDCDTTQVRYVFDKLKPHFSNLSLTLIESSKLFTSKSGVLLNAQNLSSSKKEQPKNYKEIDKIFLNFQ